MVPTPHGDPGHTTLELSPDERTLAFIRSIGSDPGLVQQEATQCRASRNLANFCAGNGVAILKALEDNRVLCIHCAK
jgi:hypothetical protein